MGRAKPIPYCCIGLGQFIQNFPLEQAVQQVPSLDLMNQNGFVSTFQPMLDAYIRWRNGPVFCQRVNNGLVGLIVDSSGRDVNPQHFLVWCGVCMNDDAFCTSPRIDSNFHPFWLHHTPCIEILFAIVPWVAPVSFTVGVIPWVQEQTIDRYGRITGFCFAAPVPRMSNEHAHTWVLLFMLDEIAFHHKPLLPVVR